MLKKCLKRCLLKDIKKDALPNRGIFYEQKIYDSTTTQQARAICDKKNVVCRGVLDPGPYVRIWIGRKSISDLEIRILIREKNVQKLKYKYKLLLFHI